MRAAILAAGIGRRLGFAAPPPKILLSFGGETLLARHVAILRHCAVERVDMVVGHHAERVEAEIDRLGARDLVKTRFNPDYAQGAIVSFWHLRDIFMAGEPVMFMDGDVLYDHRMLARLLASPADNCFLLDRTTEEGEDPVKLCMRDGVLVDFHKRPQRGYDWWGEWVGFCRFGPAIAAKIAGATARLVEAGRCEAIYEDAVREVVVGEPPGTFGVEDITGLPWVEIDFPEDLEKAQAQVLPRLADLPGEAEPRGLARSTGT